MNFTADENVDHQIVGYLRKNGHEVLSIAEINPSISDDIVLSKASERNSLLITSDKDFGELIFRQKHLTTGVVLIRLAGLSSSKKAELILSAVKDHNDEMKNLFTVISPGHVRIRSMI